MNKKLLIGIFISLIIMATGITAIYRIADISNPNSKEWHYHPYIASGNNNLLAGYRVIQDVPEIGFSVYMDVPRDFKVTVTNLDRYVAFSGTIVIKGKDTNGNIRTTSQTYNLQPNAYLSRNSDFAYVEIQSIQVTKHSGNYPILIDVGYGQKLGIPDYPFTSLNQMTYSNKYGTSTRATFETGYGTVDFGAISSGDIFTVIIQEGE
jgi:hypothetical protein